MAELKWSCMFCAPPPRVGEDVAYTTGICTRHMVQQRIVWALEDLRDAAKRGLRILTPLGWLLLAFGFGLGLATALRSSAEAIAFGVFG